jgi:hypothetical protein
MKQYVKGNITHEAASSVKYFVKLLSQSSETVSWRRGTKFSNFSFLGSFHVPWTFDDVDGFEVGRMVYSRNFIVLFGF